MIIRKKINANYTRIPNTPEDYLNDPTISAKSKGLLTQLLSKPDTWTLNINYLVKTNKEGVSAIRSGINELIASGYIHRDVTRDKSGRIRGTQHIIFDHRVSSEEACTATHQKQLPPTAGVGSNSSRPKQEPASQLKTQIKDTAPNENNRMRKIQIRKNDPVVKNKDINKLDGVTTTTTPGQKSTPVAVVESSSYPATESLNSLWDLVPEQHQQPMVKALVNQAVKIYTPLEVEEAITYASANVKGGCMQYKAYLDKTLKNKWAAGYLETITTITPAVLSPGYFAGEFAGNFAGGMSGGKPGTRFPNGTFTGSARMDNNYMACAQFLADMDVEM